MGRAFGSSVVTVIVFASLPCWPDVLKAVRNVPASPGANVIFSSFVDTQPQEGFTLVMVTGAVPRLTKLKSASALRAPAGGWSAFSEALHSSSACTAEHPNNPTIQNNDAGNRVNMFNRRDYVGCAGLVSND